MPKRVRVRVYLQCDVEWDAARNDEDGSGFDAEHLALAISSSLRINMAQFREKGRYVESFDLARNLTAQGHRILLPEDK
jgi:hypothetical protein